MHTNQLAILFLGASKRVSLLERFVEAATAMNVELRLFSCEAEEDFYPISHLARILAGPKFEDRSLPAWLTTTVEEFRIDLIIPTVDPATTALAQWKEAHPQFKNKAIVSTAELCRICEDKMEAAIFFRSHQLPVPSEDTTRFPKIAKWRKGFGSKHIVRLSSPEDLQAFGGRTDSADWLIQDFISGQETTVDCFFNKDGTCVGYVLRDRLETSDGEVMVCRTRPPSLAEKTLIENIAAIPGWRGCITIQYITEARRAPALIEINPRFGGGATCAIEAGLLMPEYILKDHLGIPYDLNPQIRRLQMTRARRDFFHEPA